MMISFLENSSQPYFGGKGCGCNHAKALGTTVKNIHGRQAPSANKNPTISARRALAVEWTALKF